MTLGDFFQWCAEHPAFLLAYFIGLPLVGVGLSIGNSKQSDVFLRYSLAAIIYAVAIPGIFAITLNIYYFMFERISINQMNLLTQVLPVIAMAGAFYGISKFTELDSIPGFGRLSGLLMIIFALFSVMWILDRTRIFAFTFIPVTYFLGFFVIVVIAIAFGWQKVKGREL